MGVSKRQYVCLLTGSQLPVFYVNRLYKMLERHAPQPFGLACFTDRKRDLLPEIQQVNLTSWPKFQAQMRDTQYRLRYFGYETCPFDEFVSLDVTLVVKSSLQPLLAFADSQPEPLVIVKDWHHPTVNGSVMRVRRSHDLEPIFADYSTGVRYPSKIEGDQDYISNAIKAHGLESSYTTFPEELIVSYRNLRKLHRKQPQLAKDKLDRACILKFHGRPRPQEVFELRYRLWNALRSPGHFASDWGFLAKEVHEWWGSL